MNSCVSVSSGWGKALVCALLGIGLLGVAATSNAQIILRPDLVISSGTPTATPSIVAPGGKVTLSSWTIKNQGAAASSGFSNGFYLSTDPVITTADTYLDGNGNTTGLAVGGTYTWGGPTLIIPANTAPGTYYLGILVDRTSYVTESNEANNYVSVPITVGVGPDLIISSGRPVASPSNVAPGGKVTLSAWTIKNQGNAAAVAFSNRFYLSTDPVITTADTFLDGNGNSLGLAAGASFSWGAPALIIPATTLPGNYYLGILVDYGNGVNELNEANNYVSVPITVGPDLTITTGAPAATPSVVVPGGRVTLTTWTLRNQGSVAGGFSNGFYLSTDPVITAADTLLTYNSNSSGLAAGASFGWGAPTLTIPASTAPGTYYLGILVDYTNAVKEFNEANNYVSVKISVVQPDMVISSGAPTVTPSSVAPGGTVQLPAWTVKNQGTAAAGAFSSGFYLSTDPVIMPADTFLGGVSNSGLAAGSSFNWGGPMLTIPATTPPGNYYLGILVDRASAVAESNEANNYVSVPIHVLSKPDLVISSGAPLLSRSAVKPGDSVAMTAWTVANKGELAAGGFSTGFYLSADPVITSTDTFLNGNTNSGLAAGAVFKWGGPTLTIPATTPPGNYYLGILVDRASAVAESNEANNYVSVPIRVGDDHGDTPATATPIAVNAEVGGEIGTGTDVDFFMVTLVAGKTYDIRTTLWTLADSKLYLYKSDGITQLGYNDDDPKGGAGSRITYTVATTGVYYLKVTGYSSSYTGTYTVKAQEAGTLAAKP